MKKLLLTLALPLMLVGCTNNNGATKEGTWVNLERNQLLTVYYGSDSKYFSLESYNEVNFRVNSSEHATTIQVKTVHSTTTTNYEYRGSTVSYVLVTTENG